MIFLWASVEMMLHMGLKKLRACNSGSFENVEVLVCLVQSASC